MHLLRLMVKYMINVVNCFNLTTFDRFITLTTLYNIIYPENMRVSPNQHLLYTTIPLYLPSNPLRRSHP